MPSSDQLWWSTRGFALAMMAIAMVPLLWPVIPPLVDLPGHMGRYAVEVAPPNSPLHRYFHFEWAVIGNLGIDLLVIPFAKLFGVELAVKLIILAIPPLTVAGMLLIAREAHGELPPTAALALPLAYGYPFQFGFVNFTLSMALSFLGFALWLRLGRKKRLRFRAAIFVPYGVALWFVHSFGWGVLGLLAFASDLVRRHGNGKSWIRSGWEAGLACIPLMPPIALMLAWRSGQVTGMTGDWFNVPAKTFYLLGMLRNEGATFDFICALVLIMIGVFGLCGIGFRRNALLLLGALLLIITYVLLPRIALGSAYADMRLAPFMIAMLLLALNPSTQSKQVRAGLAIIAVAFFLVRIGEQTFTYWQIDQGYRAQMLALDHVPKGARIYALTDLECLGKPYSTRLDHIEAMAIVRRQAFVNGQWTMAGAQLLRVDFPDAPAFAQDPTQILRPGNCRQPGSYTYPAVLKQFPRAAFDYLWLINFVPDRRPKGDPGLLPVWQGPRGALYRISRTPSAG
jgi:NADH:ubiquinone oxidoreductase subunit K